MILVCIILALLAGVALYDIFQRQHTVLRNFPIIGHLRYTLEMFGPELRQYIVTDNEEERPFNRDDRRWVYSTAKGDNPYFGFGTDSDMETVSNYLVLAHSAFPLDSPLERTEPLSRRYRLPSAKVLGGHRARRLAFRPASAVNVSAMSYGSLSASAVEALNRGAVLAGCMQSTGEGGVSGHHLHGADLVWQIGTGYFACRDEQGRFSLDEFKRVLERVPAIRAIEIKLSQGAKPGLGGMLPASKITPEIARIRGIPMGRDCVSPAAHTAFRDADSMLDFVELLADTGGRPVGIKSAVGELGFWRDLARLMAETQRGVDFITIDGGEGGTGAGPQVFNDHVALPFKVGFSRVYKEFAEAGVHEKVVFVGSGKLGLPHNAILAFGLGCDMVNVAREAMLAIGCIQAQRCHTGRCPTGVASHNPWLERGLVPTLKSVRLANYIVSLRRELLRLAHASGHAHPSLVTLESLEILDGRFGSEPATRVFGYDEGLGLPGASDRREIAAIMGNGSSS